MYQLITVLLVIIAFPASASQLIMVEQEGCEWCEVWDQEVGAIYAKTTEGKAMPLLRHNIDKISSVDYDLNGAVHYTPTFIVIDGRKEIGRITGYPGEAFFWGMLEQIINEESQQ